MRTQGISLQNVRLILPVQKSLNVLKYAATVNEILTDPVTGKE